MYLRQFVIQIADDPDMVALLQFENKKVLEILRIVNEAVFARMFADASCPDDLLHHRG